MIQTIHSCGTDAETLSKITFQVQPWPFLMDSANSQSLPYIQPGQILDKKEKENASPDLQPCGNPQP
jgi:hypothetical protein